MSKSISPLKKVSKHCLRIDTTAVKPRTFIDALLAVCPDNLRPLVCDFSQDPNNGNWTAHKLTDLILRKFYHRGDNNRYITISVFKGDRRRKTEFVAMVAVMIDDVGTKVPFEKIVLPPTYWLETSPGNFQAWYFLKVPVRDRQLAESVLNALVAQGLATDGKDPGMKGVPRYGRLPGGYNNKESLDKPHRVTAHEDTRGHDYHTIEEIIEKYELDLAAVASKHSSGAISGAIDQLDILTAQSDPIYKMFESQGLIKYVQGHKIECTCPWVDEHTNETDNGTALLIQPGGGLGFKCHHGHCEHKTLKDVHGWAKETCPEEYDTYYPGDSVNKSDEEPELSIQEVITALFDEGLSESDIAIAIPNIADEFGLTSHEIQPIVRACKKEYEESEEIEDIDLDELAKAVDISNISLELAFPKPLADAIQTKCDSDKLDPIRPVQSLLPVLGSQLGSRVHILIKKAIDEDDDWIAYPFISCIDIGIPSTGKTQTNQTVTRPLVKQQDKDTQEYIKAKELYEECCRIARRAGNELPEEPNPPIDLFLPGGTAEGIMRKISELPPKGGMLYLCDEVASLISGADQYKKGKSDFKNTLLSALSNPLKGVKARGVKDNELIPFQNQTLSICGSIQPDRIQQLFDPNSDSSGLASRFLCAYPRIPDDFDQISIDGVQVKLSQELSGVVEYFQNVGDSKSEIRCTMDRKTHRRFFERIRACRRIQKENEEKNPALSGFIGKCPGHLGTLTLNQHWMACYYEEETPGNVTVVSFNRACYLLDYYIGQFRLLQIRVSGGDQNYGKLHLHILEKLKRNSEVTDKTIRKAFNRGKKQGSKTSEHEVRQAFKVLENNGVGTLSADGKSLIKA